MVDDSQSMELEIRKRIILFLTCLRTFGMSQKNIVEDLNAQGIKIVDGTLSKAKFLDADKIKDYPVSEHLLIEIVNSLGYLLFQKLEKQPSLYSLVIPKLEEENIGIYDLSNYIIAKRKQAFALPKDAFTKFDLFMQLFGRRSVIPLIIFAIFLCFFGPYTLAFSLGVWNGIEYPFRDSSSMLFGYPVFVVSIYYIYCFLRSIPASFERFAGHLPGAITFQKRFIKAIHGLKYITPALWVLLFATVIWQHLEYLGDDKHSFFEATAGSPNAIFFLNIPALTWQLFQFIYCILVMAKLILILRWLSAEIKKPNSVVFKNRVPATYIIRKLSKPLHHITAVFLTACLYGLSFIISMDSLSGKSGGILRFDWQVVETIEMFVPLVLHAIGIFTYIFFVAKIRQAGKRPSLREIQQTAMLLYSRDMNPK